MNDWSDRRAVIADDREHHAGARRHAGAHGAIMAADALMAIAVGGV